MSDTPDKKDDFRDYSAIQNSASGAINQFSGFHGWLSGAMRRGGFNS
jgi:hypothetical protein